METTSNSRLFYNEYRFFIVKLVLCIEEEDTRIDATCYFF